MKKSQIIKWAVVDALGIFAYISLVALVLFNGEKIFGPIKTFAGPVLVLLLFVVSAVITGSLFLGRPILLYLDGQKREGIKLFLYTLACLVAVLIVFLILATLVF